MNMESVESVIYDVTAEFFHGATVIWAEQVNTKPDLPYVTLKTGNLNRNHLPKKRRRRSQARIFRIRRQKEFLFL